MKQDFEFRSVVIPVKMISVDSTLTYNNPDLLKQLEERRWEEKEIFYRSGRLTSWRLAECIGFLMRKEFHENRKKRTIKVHLVIPPELIFTAKKILESENTPEAQIPIVNFVSQYVEAVWIDPGIEMIDCPPNFPWFVFSDADLITGDQVNVEKMCYHSGMAP